MLKTRQRLRYIWYRIVHPATTRGERTAVKLAVFCFSSSTIGLLVSPLCLLWLGIVSTAAEAYGKGVPYALQISVGDNLSIPNHFTILGLLAGWLVLGFMWALGFLWVFAIALFLGTYLKIQTEQKY